MPRQLTHDERLAEIEELRAQLGPSPEERAAVAAERRKLRARARMRALEAERPKCSTCLERPPVGWVRPEKRTLFACDVCFVPAPGKRYVVHEWLTRLVERGDGDETAESIRNMIHAMAGEKAAERARADARGKNLAAASATPWTRGGKTVTVCDPEEEAERARAAAYKPSVRLVRTALRFDPRFTYEPPEREFEAGWWSWEAAGT